MVKESPVGVLSFKLTDEIFFVKGKGRTKSQLRPLVIPEDLVISRALSLRDHEAPEKCLGAE